MKQLTIVYQFGIANLFDVTSGVRDRLFQTDYRGAEMFALGAKWADVEVDTMACSQTGNIADATWTHDLASQPYSDQFRPVYSSGNEPIRG